MLEDLCNIIYMENFKIKNCYKNCYNISNEEIDFAKNQANYLNKLLLLELEVKKK